jgi:RNA polymerase sigma-70 factor (ECF subfamily)
MNAHRTEYNDEKLREMTTPPQTTGADSQPKKVASADDWQMVEALRTGDEAAFTLALDRYHKAMVRLAGIYVRDPATAEDVAQETWVAVLRELDQFQGRSSFKTWIFSILTNRAKTRGQKEGRYISLSLDEVEDSDTESSEPAVSLERFQSSEGPWPHHWISLPRNWDYIPEERFDSQETRAHIQQAIDTLPSKQREVITLRDVEGLPSEEVRSILEISDTNQRVLLHRARSKVRRALEQYLGE